MHEEVQKRPEFEEAKNDRSLFSNFIPLGGMERRKSEQGRMTHTCKANIDLAMGTIVSWRRDV